MILEDVFVCGDGLVLVREMFGDLSDDAAAF